MHLGLSQGLKGVVMAQVKIGWYLIEESFEADGSIDMAIRDKRSNELVSFQVNSLEDYDKIISYLKNNQQLNMLSKLKTALGS
jgi:hypothetical protein